MWKKALIITLAASLMAACNRQLTPEEINNRYRNSVALVFTSYYFTITTDNGITTYFTLDENDDAQFFDTEQEAIDNAGMMQGTGFFISSDGEIATNRHVIYPEADYQQWGKELNRYMQNLKEEVRLKIREKEVEQSQLQVLYAANMRDTWNYDPHYSQQLSDQFDLNNDSIKEWKTLIDRLDFNPNNTRTSLHRIFLGIACNNTYFSSLKDLKECVPLKTSEVDEVDLAIIQLKDKTTPSSVDNLILLPTPEDTETDNSLKINDQVFMLGFNGVVISNTRSGIKSQFTEGKITQEPDGARILYSIPTLHGSSGSPVFDIYGNLIAINFAKMQEDQGFSFGIPATELLKLQENRQSTLDETFSVAGSTKSKKFAAFDAKSVIRKFVDAEDERDMERILPFFAAKVLRYYDITNPSRTVLRQQYVKSWQASANGKNSIHSIERVNEYVWDLHTTFSYYDLKKQEQKSVESRVRFTFDKNGKITELYSNKK